MNNRVNERNDNSYVQFMVLYGAVSCTIEEKYAEMVSNRLVGQDVEKKNNNNNVLIYVQYKLRA